VLGLTMTLSFSVMPHTKRAVNFHSVLIEQEGTDYENVGASEVLRVSKTLNLLVEAMYTVN
jgi:hypothetical protein